MKISVITSPFGYIPPNGYGAVERRWFDVCTIMSKIGCDVTFLSKRKDNPKYENLNFIGVEGFQRTGRIYTDLILDFIYSYRALRLLPETEVLILNTFWSPFLCRFFKRKFRVSIYNVARMPKGQLWLYHNVNRFACVSTAVYNRVLKYSKKFQTKSVVINNPINTEIFRFTEPKPITEPIVILYFGRIHPEKGIHILLNAVSQLRKENHAIEVSLVGPTSIEYGGGGNTYVELLNSLADNFNLNIHPPVTESKQLKNMLDKADIFCYPSIAEGGETFGVAPLEAMGSGRATIVSSLECFKDFVEDGKNALVFDHRVKKPEFELRNEIVRLINNSGLRNKLAWEGAKTAQYFSNENIAHEYLEDFYRILEVPEDCRLIGSKTKTTLKVSVIIPVYNGEGYIEDCLNSITSQSYSQIEIIVINDGSSDQTANIIKRIALSDSRIVVINQENQGTNHARHNGIRHSKGDAVLHLDADDLLEANSIEWLVEEMIKSKSNYVIGYHKRLEKGRKKRVKNEIPFDNNRIEVIKYLLLGKLSGYLWGRLIKKELYDHVNPPSKRIYSEDIITNLSLFCSGQVRLGIVHNSLVNYRIHSSNVSYSKRTEPIEHFYEETSEIKKLLQKEGILERVYDEYVAFLCRNWVVYCRKNGAKSKDLQYRLNFFREYYYIGLLRIPAYQKLEFICYTISPALGRRITMAMKWLELNLWI